MPLQSKPTTQRDVRSVADKKLAARIARENRLSVHAAADVLDAAIGLRKAYEKWFIERDKDIGESLRAYNDELEIFLKKARTLMLSDERLAKLTTKVKTKSGA